MDITKIFLSFLGFLQDHWGPNPAEVRELDDSMFLGDLLAQHPVPQNRLQCAAQDLLQSNNWKQRRNNIQHPWISLNNMFWRIHCKSLELSIVRPVRPPKKMSSFANQKPFGVSGSSYAQSPWRSCWTRWSSVEAGIPMIASPLRNTSSTVTWFHDVSLNPEMLFGNLMEPCCVQYLTQLCLETY